ncbi:MAG: hypothetical protein GF398_11485 [Chitinivibrionales bacterium]|nr:hypothetical protein [Chitinivibrionales bacterium]
MNHRWFFARNSIRGLPLIAILFIDVSGAGLLSNGDFENGFSAWQTKVNAPYQADFSVSNSHPHTGSGSARIKVTNSANEYWAFRYHHVRMKQTGFSLRKNDIVRLQFNARYQGSHRHPMVQAGFAPDKPEAKDFWDLEDDDMSNFLISGDWRHYSMDLIVTRNAGSDIAFLMRFGGMTGEYFIDGISLEVVDNRSSENDWLTNAQTRIDTLRKGNLKLLLQGRNSTIVPNSKVEVTLLRHNFQWGTSVRSADKSNWTSSDRRWERREILKLFNTIVNENDFKWPETESSRNTPNYGSIDPWLDWKDDHSLQFRGHCLFWPKEMWMPGWWPGLKTADQIESIRIRCTRDVARFGERVNEYDVVNEPVHFTFVEDLVGESIYRKAFEWAHQANPTAKLYVNDWWNIDKWDSWRLRTWTEKRLAEGAPVHGIGLQAHWDNERVDWQEVRFKSDYLAETGLPLKVTEFDMDVNRIGMTRKEQASDYATMMKLVFGHPAYEGFLIWGLQDGWREDAGIFNDNKSPRPVRDTMHHLIREVWTTDTGGTTGSDGTFAFDGYFGDYRVVTTLKNQRDTFEVNFSKENHVGPVQTLYDGTPPPDSFPSFLHNPRDKKQFHNHSPRFFADGTSIVFEDITLGSALSIYGPSGRLYLHHRLTDKTTSMKIDLPRPGVYVVIVKGSAKILTGKIATGTTTDRYYDFLTYNN